MDKSKIMEVEEIVAREADNLIGIEACLIGLMSMQLGDVFHETYHAYLKRTREMSTEERMRYFRNKHTILSGQLVESEGYGWGV